MLTPCICTHINVNCSQPAMLVFKWNTRFGTDSGLCLTSSSTANIAPAWDYDELCTVWWVLVPGFTGHVVHIVTMTLLAAAVLSTGEVKWIVLLGILNFESPMMWIPHFQHILSISPVYCIHTVCSIIDILYSWSNIENWIWWIMWKMIMLY